MVAFNGQDMRRLQHEFETASPVSVLRWAVQTFCPRMAIVTSFQPTGIVIAHMMSEIAPNIAVITLDTGLLFPETYRLIDEVESELHINLVRVRPAQTVTEQAATHGDELWKREPNRCCNLRKVQPLNAALQGYDAWITGLRRDQSPQRASTPVIDFDPQRPGVVKLAPLATWDESMIWTYIHAHELPYNELHDRSYPSIGCQPCTRPVKPGEDPRAGRWSNANKTECGLHLPDADDT